MRELLRDLIGLFERMIVMCFPFIIIIITIIFDVKLKRIDKIKLR